MRFGLSVIALAGLLGAGCLSPDPQPARPIAKAEIEKIERLEEDADGGPGLIKLNAAEIEKSKSFRPHKDGWGKRGVQKVGDEGIEVDLGKVQNSTRVEVIFGNAQLYQLVFFNGSEQVGTSKAMPQIGISRTKLAIRRVWVPRSATSKGYDRILIKPIQDHRRSIASVRVLPPAEADKWDRQVREDTQRKRRATKKGGGDAKPASGAAAKKPAPSK